MRPIAKGAASALAWLVAAPLAYPVKWLAPLDGRDSLFRTGSQAVSLIPGTPGTLVRRQYYRTTLARVGRGLTVEFGTLFARRETEIGDNVYIGAFCTIGLCRIEDDVLIGSNVDVVSGKRVHHFDRTDVPIRLQGGTLRQVSIGPDAWLGNKAVVMASVAKGCVVGAGSVVTADTRPMGIYVGAPAARLKDRKARPSLKNERAED